MGNHLAAGWVWDQHKAAVLHFEHMRQKQADKLTAQTDQIWVVETINSTLAEGGSAVHHNCYYAFSLAGAIGLAAQIEIDAQVVAENVVNIRRATHAEVMIFDDVYSHYTAQEIPALSESEAAQLGGQR